VRVKVRVSVSIKVRVKHSGTRLILSQQGHCAELYDHGNQMEALRA
jgi:hypothetical protein